MSERLKSADVDVVSYRLPGGDAVVQVVGPLDAGSAPRLMDELASVDPRTGDRVVLHLPEVESLDSAGVGALFYLEAFVRVRRGRLFLCMPTQSAEASMTRLRLEQHFSFADEPAAPRSRSGPRPTVAMYAKADRSVKEDL